MLAWKWKCMSISSIAGFIFFIANSMEIYGILFTFSRKKIRNNLDLFIESNGISRKMEEKNHILKAFYRD